MDIEDHGPLKNLSVSKIEKAMLCPRAFRFQYIDRIPTPSSGRFLSGNVIHAVVEKGIREKAKGKLPDVKTLEDFYDAAWKDKVAEEENKEEFLGWDWDNDDPADKVKADYRRMIPCLHEVLQTLNPWMLGKEPVVEYRVDLELASAMGPFRNIGRIDLLEASGILMDWKTTEDKVSDRAKRLWLQFAAYSLWAYPIVGEENLKCQKIFVVRGKKPFTQRCDYVITQKHREYFVKVAAEVWQMVKAQAYIPVTDTWFCKPGWCAYHSGCQGEF